MDERRARAILEERVDAGGTLVVAQEAPWATVKRLQGRCHAAGIPSMLARCDSGG